MSNLKVHARDVLRIIPDEELAKLAKDTTADYRAKVLTGKSIFNLLVYAFLSTDKVYPRKLELIFKDEFFKMIFNKALGETDTHDSIANKLKNVNIDFFETAFELIYTRLSQMCTEKELAALNIVGIDNFIVAETCRKLKKAFAAGKNAKGRKERKLTTYNVENDRLTSKLAESFSEPAYLREDMGIPEYVRDLIKHDKLHDNLYLLDRKVCPRKKPDTSSDTAMFVGRIKTNRKMQVVESLMDVNTDTNLGKMVLTDDLVVNLFDKETSKFSDTKHRVVKAKLSIPCDTSLSDNNDKVKRKEEELYIITNNIDMTPQEIVMFYERFCDIEIFMDFLRRNLCYSKFQSTNDNSLKIILYMTIITPMLTMIYKKENNVGFHVARMLLGLEMEEWTATWLTSSHLCPAKI